MSIPSGLLAHIRGYNVTIAWCWKITRKDGTVFGFTTHVQDLPVSSVTYAAATGFMVTAIDNTDGLAVDNLEISGVLTSAAFQSNDFQAGLWDNAALQIFFVNYLDTSLGIATRFRGTIGEVKRGRVGFTAEQLGITQPLAQTRLDLTSRQCRAVLGDSLCQVDLGPFTRTGTIGTSTIGRQFTDSARVEPDGWWAGGNMTMTSGASAGQSMEIKSSLATGAFETVLPFFFGVAPTDTYSMTPGCNHLLKTSSPGGSFPGTVFHVFSTTSISVTGLGAPTGFFTNGMVTFLTGANAGNTGTVLAYRFDGTFGFFDFVAPFPSTINIGDTFTVATNADQISTFPVFYLGDCIIKYGNPINNQSEPETQGSDSLAAYGTRA